ncbi:MAG: hypothetical protein PHU06_08980 [Gallionella sp.]|nr:hypothetical protein [Gallionella sp.]
MADAKMVVCLTANPPYGLVDLRRWATKRSALRRMPAHHNELPFVMYQFNLLCYACRVFDDTNSP